jgi:hypothetical protein
MKKASSIVGFLLLLSLLAACLAGCFAVSLHPLYTPGDLLFDEKLVGAWTVKESNEKWVFTPQGNTVEKGGKPGKAYRLIHTQGDDKVVMVARLLAVKGTRFLDFSPVEDDSQKRGTFPLLPAHAFVVVLRTQPTLRLCSLNYDWLDKYLKKNPGAVKHERVRNNDGDGEQIVLTSSSREMQRFVLSHLKTEGAFNKPFDLTRQGQ